MFAVEAMHNYGRDEEAVASAYRLFDHAKGLLGGEPINENYNPKTGDRLNATNFGWSSAAFYKRDCQCFFLHQSRVSTHSANASFDIVLSNLVPENHVTSSETRS